MEKYDSIIYSRNISLIVTIPEQYVFEFMKEFAEKFSGIDLMEGAKYIAPVDTYSYHPNGWHVKLTVWEERENEFYDFLNEFCLKRNAFFRDPRPANERNMTFKELGVGENFIFFPKPSTDIQEGDALRYFYHVMKKTDIDPNGFNAVGTLDDDKVQVPDYVEVIKIDSRK